MKHIITTLLLAIASLAALAQPAGRGPAVAETPPPCVPTTIKTAKHVSGATLYATKCTDGRVVAFAAPANSKPTAVAVKKGPAAVFAEMAVRAEYSGDPNYLREDALRLLATN